MPLPRCVGPAPDKFQQFQLDVLAILARPPLLTSTTLHKLGHSAKRQRTAIPLSAFATGVMWEDRLWGNVAVSIGLLKRDDGNTEGLQSIFTRLLNTAPTSTPFQLHDVHSCRSVCGDDLKPDCVMSLRHKPLVPMTTGLVLDLKRHDNLYDSSEHAGKAIIYGRTPLQQLPRSLRNTVLVGLTDLHSITLIKVTLSSAGNSVSVQVGQSLPDVRRVLLQLLSSQPSDLHVHSPDLGPSVEITDLLGYGATSHVYTALKDGQQASAYAKAAPSHHHVHLTCLLSKGGG